jgi:hypothetical protein
MPASISSQLNELTRRVKGVTDTAKRDVPTQYYQCVIFYTETYGRLWYKHAYTFPFYSSEIFMDPESASAFMPYFVRTLIEKGHLPNEVVQEDKSLDPAIAKAAVAPLVLTQLEQKRDE